MKQIFILGFVWHPCSSDSWRREKRQWVHSCYHDPSHLSLSGVMTQYWLIKTQISSSSLLTLHSQILASFYLRKPNRTLLDENSIQEISKHVKGSRVPYTAAVYSQYDSAFLALDSLSISASHSFIGPLPCPSERTRECIFVRARTPAWLCICASLFMPVKSCYRRQQ